MYKTPLNKRLPYTAKRNSKNLSQKQQIRSFNSYNNSIILHSNGKNIDQNYRRAQQTSLKEETMSVMKQLATSYFYAVCQNFEMAFTEQMNLMNQKFLILEYQIAGLQKKFNAIQILLHKKSKQIVTVIDENRTLLQLNNDIEQRIQQLRQKYQISNCTLKNQWLQNKINQFRYEIRQFQIRSKQCQGCQKGIKQRIRKQLVKIQENSSQNSNYQVVKDSLKSIIETLCQSSQQRQHDYLQPWKSKILQNIDLKFDIINLQQKIAQMNLKSSSERPKSEVKLNE